MATKLAYAIVYVADMEKAVAFYRDTLGQTLKFASPFWSEFVTGDVTLALHPATPDKPAGKVQLGFNMPRLKDRYAAQDGTLEFVGPLRDEHGVTLATIKDSEGAEITLSS
jgi:catechol 2,3-dioxygenase-like lactoylglutathione lyase family enzyme